MRYYTLHDSDMVIRAATGAQAVDEATARRMNAEGFGIFWAANTHRGARRLVNLREVRFWFCEIDGADKPAQLARLRRSPLLPSAVVESRNGYHAYWRAKDATIEKWKRIVRWGIVPALGGDPKATDVLRILRAPGFNHVKDPGQPFMVRTVWRLEAEYTEAQMLRAFPNKEPAPVERQSSTLPTGEGTFWQRVAALDCREALRRLSGHWLCNGERFTLQEQANGHANVIRTDDGYSTGSFVDAHGRLGCVDGGSSIAAWCHWYQHDWSVVARGLREVFPELDGEQGVEEGEAREAEEEDRARSADQGHSSAAG